MDVLPLNHLLKMTKMIHLCYVYFITKHTCFKKLHTANRKASKQTSLPTLNSVSSSLISRLTRGFLDLRSNVSIVTRISRCLVSRLSPSNQRSTLLLVSLPSAPFSKFLHTQTKNLSMHLSLHLTPPLRHSAQLFQLQRCYSWLPVLPPF